MISRLVLLNALRVALALLIFLFRPNMRLKCVFSSEYVFYHHSHI